MFLCMRISGPCDLAAVVPRSGHRGLGLASGFSGMVQPAVSAELARGSGRCLLIWLPGGASQLETWDPKPGTDTGGPFRSIETSVPGVRISELLPLTARQMHRMALVRGVNTKEDDHGKGQYLMQTGRRELPGQEYPHLGSLAAKYLTSEQNPLPGYVHIQPGGGGLSGREAAFLGPKYGSLVLGNGQAPANTTRAGSIERRRRHRARDAPAPPERPVRPPSPDGRDRRLHDHL